MTIRRKCVPLALAGMVVVALAGCGGEPPTAVQAGNPSSPAFPRTIELSNRTVTIPTPPQRIAALTSDVADLAIELVGSQRLIAAPAGMGNPVFSNHVAEAERIPNKLPSGVSPEPERILSWNPDLVLVTPRHGSEKSAEQILAEAGIPMITIENSWASIDDVKNNIKLLGNALGAEDVAAMRVADLDRRLSEVESRVAEVGSKPSVLILSNQTARPFINAGDVVTAELVRRAGADLSAGRLGIQRTAPVSAEQIVAANPDAILLIDVTGEGDRSYRPLLDQPAVKNVNAVRNAKVQVLPARICYVAAGVRLAEGLDTIARWLHPEAFG